MICNSNEEAFVWACRDTPIDFQSMQVASQYFLGQHDFTAFSAVHAKDKDPDPVKEAELTGSGFSHSLRFVTSDTNPAFTMKGMTLQYFFCV